MSLADAIAEALANADPPPPNESTTCEWVIYPLLLAAGYSRRDIVSRIADNNGQYPDYTILPDSAHTWFLEAKAWNVMLQDSHAQQSLNYANQNGKRWVVLTNGREWRLYDNTIQGLAVNKLVADSNLREEGFAGFIAAIGRASFQDESIHNYVSHAQVAKERNRQLAALQQILSTEIGNANSRLVAAITADIRNRDGLSGVTTEDVYAYFQSAARAATINPIRDHDATPQAQIEPRVDGLRFESSKSTDSQNPHRLFWSGLLDRVRARGVRLHSRRNGTDYNWIGTSAGRHGLGYNYVVWKSQRTRTELYIDTGDSVRNKEIFDQLLRRRDAIDVSFGEPLDWEPLPDRRACRISKSIYAGGLNDGIERWPAIHETMIDHMERLAHALQPHIDELPR